MIDDEYIINYFRNKKTNRIQKVKLKSLNSDNSIFIYLKNRYNDCQTLEESLYRIFHNIEYKDICPICKKDKIYFSNFKTGYLKTCKSDECKRKNKSINSSFHNPEIQNKCKQTILNKYGVTNPYNIKEIQDKCIKHSQSKEANDKRKQSCLEKYGVDNPWKNKDIIEKIKQTNLEKYGGAYASTEEYKQYMINLSLLKYNSEWPSKSQIVKDKVKNTVLEHFGVPYFFQTDRCKQLSKTIDAQNKRNQTIKEKYNNENFFDTLYYKEKSYETKKKNKTFNTSKTELESYLILKEKYQDTVRQYSDDRYPFACDFYIPSLDLFIECNYHWTHGGKLFKDTKEDIQKLEKWKNKNTKYYNNAIKTWTDLDIRKQNIAKENKLNYLVFYNINEFNNWINTI